MVYEFSCLKFQEDGRDAKYFGASVWTMSERIAEHSKQIQKMNPESPMVGHQLEQHKEETPKFRVKIFKSCKNLWGDMFLRELKLVITRISL